jgi:hypothetical protein
LVGNRRALSLLPSLLESFDSVRDLCSLFGGQAAQVLALLISHLITNTGQKPIAD